MNLKKTGPLFLMLLLLIGCGEETTVDRALLGDSLVRTDGTYVARRGGLVYFAQFYPKGNAVLLGGPEKAEQRIKLLIKPDAVNGEENVHNVPVTIIGDSVKLVTAARKGNIDYVAKVTTSDSIVFHKYSHVNGKSAVVTYHFDPN